MRLISKYQDYYDCMQKMEQHDHHGPTSDVKSVTSDLRPWIRKETKIPVEEVDLDFNLPYLRVNTHNFCKGIGIGSFIIGFCGKIYAGLLFSGTIISKDNYSIKERCYCIEEVDRVIEKLYNDKILSKKEYDFYYETNKKRIKKPYSSFWDKNNKNIYMHRAQLAQSFKDLEEKREGYDAYFELGKAPIFTIRRDFFDDYPYGFRGGRDKRFIVFNPVLADYQFYRVFDAPRAWQEITMYMGNMCFPEVEPNPISDELKAETHGFNKFSFRKAPQKKK